MKKQTLLIIASILGLALAAGATILVRDAGSVRADIHAVSAGECSSAEGCPLTKAASACCSEAKAECDSTAKAACDSTAKAECSGEAAAAACPLSAKSESAAE